MMDITLESDRNPLLQQVSGSTCGTSTRIINRLIQRFHQSSSFLIQAPRMVYNDWLESDPLFVALSLSTLVTSFKGNMFLNDRVSLSGPKRRDDRKVNRYPWETMIVFKEQKGLSEGRLASYPVRRATTPMDQISISNLLLIKDDISHHGCNSIIPFSQS